MCGVAGIVGMNDAQLAGTAVQKMLDSLAHRGPDAQGLHVQEGIALGHKRLKIIDLSSAADQPFHSEDGRFTMVFNGEIYNYELLSGELGLTNTKTSSDTEVLLQAYMKWGVNCLARLNGMFVFAIYDNQEQELVIARDRMGIKPLYYHQSDDRLVFASELAAVLDSELVPRVRERVAALV